MHLEGGARVRQALQHDLAAERLDPVLEPEQSGAAPKAAPPPAVIADGDPQHAAFDGYQYDGADYAADMAGIASDEATRRWWQLTDPCQQPVDSAAEGEWWAPAEEVFHLD